jgi:hypothetical protein
MLENDGRLHQEIGRGGDLAETEAGFRTNISHRDYMREHYGNVATKIERYAIDGPTWLFYYDLTHNFTKFLSQLSPSPFLRPSKSLHMTVGSRPQRHALTARRTMDIIGARPGSVVDERVRTSVCDDDYMLLQPVGEIAEEICPQFGELFLSGWGLDRIPTRDENTYRWATREGVFISGVLPGRAYRRLSNVTPQPVIVDVTSGKIREKIDYFQVRYSVPVLDFSPDIAESDLLTIHEVLVL